MSEEIDSSVLDSLYRCLADTHRRLILSYLCHRGDVSVPVDTLVDTIARHDHLATASDPHDIAIALYHTHLPALAASGLIEYDRDRGLVSTTPRTDQIEPYLALVPTFEPSLDPPD